MKLKLLAILILSAIQLNIYAQRDSMVVNPEYLSTTPETVISKFDASRESQYILYFPMKYARFLFTAEDKALIRSISDTIVERIDLVYTVFRRDKNYDQVKLNKERYEMLRYFFPEAFQSNLIEWKLVAQDGAIDYATAKDYFHGFVIYLKPHRVSTIDGTIISSVMDKRVDEPGIKVVPTSEEIKFVKESMSKVIGKTTTKVVKDTVVTWKQQRTWTGYYLHHNPKKRGKGKKFKKKGNKKRPKEYFMKKVRTVEVVEKTVEVPAEEGDMSVGEAIGTLTTDTVVYKTLTTNYEKWKDYVIVQDVTGSMYPYITQTLLFLKTHKRDNQTEKFVFFNDGDKKPDGLIGRTGGLYYVSASDPLEIESTAFAAMAGGRGGKAPENDIEAILHGVQKFPNCKGVVLIADNYSPVRDIKLIGRLARLGKPIDVVICEAGKQGEVHVHYLYIAQVSGGTIHTLDASYSDLQNKGDGDFFKVGSQVFKMEGKSIKLVRK